MPNKFNSEQLEACDDCDTEETQFVDEMGARVRMGKRRRNGKNKYVLGKRKKKNEKLGGGTRPRRRTEQTLRTKKKEGREKILRKDGERYGKEGG